MLVKSVIWRPSRKPKRFARGGALAAGVILVATACTDDSWQTAEVCFDGGAVNVGSTEHYPEERPLREIGVAAFCMDKHEVTLAEFARFVTATGYATVAETGPSRSAYPDAPEEFFQPGSAVFVFPENGKDGYWTFKSTANWRQPAGNAITLIDGDKHPVTQVALADAKAYAMWRGRRLPSEAEWEFAARAGASVVSPEETHRVTANIWHGLFPIFNKQTDGFAGTAPVGSFEPDQSGIYDLLGNVWEWTADRYEPVAADRSKQNVIKGGSHLCAANFCARYRPSARQPQDAGLGTSHIGFRTVRDR